ncbi:MAG: FecR family protein [Myxococcota bacterium]
MFCVTVLMSLSVAAPAKALSVVGTVESRVGEADFAAVKRYQLVEEGTELRTRTGSRLTLRLASGTLLRLGPDTTLVLAEMNHDQKIKARRKESVKLSAGRVWASVLSLFGADSKFEVSGRTAVAGVRGTSFIMTTDEEDDEIILEEGEVAVSLGDKTFELNQPGQVFSSADETLTVLDLLSVGQLQLQTGGSVSSSLNALQSGPAGDGNNGSDSPGLQVRQEINGQDEVADSQVTLDNDPSNEARDVAEVIIRLVPES